MFILIHLISLARKKITVSLSQLTAASCVLPTKMSSKRFKKKEKKKKETNKERKKARQRIKKKKLNHFMV